MRGGTRAKSPTTASTMIDDGYVDDVHGINVVNHSSDPMDDRGHGTHTAGTIAGVGDNTIGIVGVNWNAKVLACKFLDATGSGTDAGAVECFNYVVGLAQRGVNIRVTSNSWGSPRQGGQGDSGAPGGHRRGGRGKYLEHLRGRQQRHEQ